MFLQPLAAQTMYRLQEGLRISGTQRSFSYRLKSSHLQRGAGKGGTASCMAAQTPFAFGPVASGNLVMPRLQHEQSLCGSRMNRRQSTS